MKNQWSPVAGGTGFLVAVMLASATDIPDAYFVRVVCAGPALLGQLLRLFGLGLPASYWISVPLVLVGAFGNAAWYMILSEAMRLPLEHLLARIRLMTNR